VSRAIDPEDPVVRIEVVLVPLLIESLYGQDSAPSVAPCSRLLVRPFIYRLPWRRPCAVRSALAGAARRAAGEVTSGC